MADATPALERAPVSRPGRKPIRVTSVVIYLILIAGAAVAALPFFWMFSTSLMTLGETINRQWVPAHPQWVNYQVAWTEAKFAKYFVNSVSNRDYPVIMGTILLYAFILVIANAAVDIVYAFLDPRIRIQ